MPCEIYLIPTGDVVFPHTFFHDETTEVPEIFSFTGRKGRYLRGIKRDVRLEGEGSMQSIPGGSDKSFYIFHFFRGGA